MRIALAIATVAASVLALVALAATMLLLTVSTARRGCPPRVLEPCSGRPASVS